MAPKPMPWFRYYSETRRDIKLAKVARLANISLMEASGFWSTILSIGNESPIRGALYVTLHERYNIDDVTIECNAQKETVERVMDAFCQMEMLNLKDGAWHITNWDKRQFSSDKSAERVKNFRDRKAAEKECNDNVTTTSVSVSVSASASDPVYASVCKTYENEIGALSPAISDELKSAVDTYPSDWIIDAIGEAVKNNARKWKYVLAILKRWKVTGKTLTNPTGNGKKSGLATAEDFLALLEDGTINGDE